LVALWLTPSFSQPANILIDPKLGRAVLADFDSELPARPDASTSS